AAGRKLRIKVAAMPAGEDPAEMVVAEGGAEKFLALVESAVDLPEFQIGLIMDGVDRGSPQERDRGLAEAAPVLAEIPPGATREELVRRVAESLQIDATVVVARVEGSGEVVEAKTANQTAPKIAATGTVLSRRERQERHLLAMCVAKPDEGRDYIAKLAPKHLSSPLMVRTVAWLKNHLDEPAEGLDPEDRELQRLVAALVVRANPDQVGSGSIRRNFMELELAALEDEIAASAGSDDLAARAALNRRRAELVEQVARAEADAQGM
ncbi:MAG: hypothetical protein M3Y45_01910, partial [Actinomycetota bacterium]|nr:hypothetical protein [Actinomycetota bacterium]